MAVFWAQVQKVSVCRPHPKWKRFSVCLFGRFFLFFSGLEICLRGRIDSAGKGESSNSHWFAGMSVDPEGTGGGGRRSLPELAFRPL